MMHALLADRRGATAVLTALTLATVMGFVALGIESATGLHKGRALQDAADAAALAGSLAQRAGSTGNPLALATAVLAQNGVTAQSGHDVQVQMLGPSNSESPIEVRISRQRPARFGGLLGDGGGSISARAVAHLVPEAQGCLLGLADGQAIQTSRPSDLRLDGCTALSSQHGLSRIRVAEADPYRDVVLPPAYGCQATATVVRSATTAAGGGRPFAFCGGLTIAQDGKLALQPGTYIISGGPLQVQSGGSLSGRGITIILGSGAAATFAPGSAISIEAPDSGSLAGIAIAGGTSAGQASLLGGRSQRIVGAVHLPAGTLQFAGSAASPCTQLIASRILTVGETRLESRCAGTGARPLLDRVARLME